MIPKQKRLYQLQGVIPPPKTGINCYVILSFT
jgi:hypothetical protein